MIKKLKLFRQRGDITSWRTHLANHKKKTILVEKMIFNIVVLGFVFITVVNAGVLRQKGYCSMYGSMVDKPYQKFNLPYNGLAKNVTQEIYDVMKDVCPYLTTKEMQETKSCCSYSQVKKLKDQLQTASTLFSRCPSCTKNFYDMWCEFTCSPDQSTFLEYHYNPKTPYFVPTSKYYITQAFSHGLYNSCKDVVFPGTNGLVLDFMCGTTAALCTPSKFLSFVGDPSNAPFSISFEVDKNVTNITNNDFKMIGCNETYFNTKSSRNTSTCSCQDCQLTCPIPPIPPLPPKPKYILGIKEYYVFVGVAYLCWLLLFLVYNIIYVLCAAMQMQKRLTSRADLLRNDSVLSNDLCYLDQSTENLIPAVETQSKKKCLVHFGIETEKVLQKLFRKWGLFCANHPRKVILISFVIALGCSLGLLMFTVVTNPVDLWSASDSEARMEKNYFDEKFSPFYRTEQVIITSTVERPPVPYKVYQKPGFQNFSGVMYGDIMNATLVLQLELMNLIGRTETGEPVRLEDVCFQPLAPDNTYCTIMSVMQYFQNSEKNLDKCVTNLNDSCWKPHAAGIHAEDWHDQILGCTRNPSSASNGIYLRMPCMSQFGAPVSPKLVLGGFTDNNYINAKALIITFVIRNHLNESHNKKAEAWEKVFLDHLKHWQKHVAPALNLRVAYSSERSVQDEISRSSESDVATILVSYVLMFLYIAVGLGEFKSVSRILVDAKITVGIIGVIIVLLSVTASLGVFSYAGVPATLIIIEVIPFLVLAVGVDNIFILVQALQRDKKKSSETISEQVGRVLGTVGPSMLLSSLSEAVAFGFGALSTMPAVHTFSMFASLAVAFNFLLQISMLVAVVALDAKRQSEQRYDVACCSGLPKDERNDETEECVPGGILYYLTKSYYAPFVMLYPVRIVVVLVFSTLLAISICLIPSIDVGLDQTQAFPEDSYLMNYFGNISAYLKTGAPVYFVVKEGYNYSDPKLQNGICGVAGCNDDSVVGSIFTESLISNYSSIALPASSWIDDYFAWLDPVGPCCRIVNYTTYTEPNSTVTHKNFTLAGDFCPSSAPKNWYCYSCLDASMSGTRPDTTQFDSYLRWYLKDNPTKLCSKGGHPAYGSAVNLNEQRMDNPVKSSYFMTYHTVASTSQQFTHCLKYAREIAANISRVIDHDVFAYSVFYVFYEQYLTIVEMAWKDLLICLGSITVVTFVLMGFNLGLAICIAITVAMIIIDLLGIMYLWGISLNAVALVNLIMATGISVEFCSHIARAYSTSPYETRIKRAEDALGSVGSSVFCGITLTKFVGVFVLMFAKSQLFKIYYFRMYMGVILVGAFHGLLFLPVLLSYVGPSSRATEEDRKRASLALHNPNTKDSIGHI